MSKLDTNSDRNYENNYGPIYFNVYPDLNLLFIDPNLLETTSFNIKTHEYEYLSKSWNDSNNIASIIKLLVPYPLKVGIMLSLIKSYLGWDSFIIISCIHK